jgi:D-alanyl-D-alanine carboxypeptidase/D-alanyl-D-alanine-endopeptidase (penicillin-binding protein 4)
MQKLLLVLLILLNSLFVCYSQDYSKINNDIKELQQTDALKHAQWSIYAEYVNSGETIVSYHSEESLAPASGLKLFTTSTALNLLGEDYRFKTKLYYDGFITDDGILKGNIYIVGGGDPTLGSDLVAGSLPLDSLMWSWTQAVMKLKINKVEGAIIADALLFDGKRVPDYWNWMDIGNYYGAGTSALTINDNLYYLYFHPSVVVGNKAEVIQMVPEIPGLHFTNYVKTGPKGSGDNGYIYCAPNQFNATLRGTVPAGVSSFSIKGSIPNPPLFAAQYFEQFLEGFKIIVTMDPRVLTEPVKYDESKLITSTISPPLKDIVYMINKKSDNLYTEQLLKTIALKEKGIGSTEEGINVIKSFLDSVGVPTDGFKLYDGCGLSRTDMITTKIMVKLLIFMTKQKTFDSFYNSLAVVGKAGDPGYFSNFGANTLLQNNARIKSGLITGVRSFSGYLKDLDGRMIAFSMIANNHSGTTKQIDDIHKQILLDLASLK